jgi:hypothetical protein
MRTASRTVTALVVTALLTGGVAACSTDESTQSLQDQLASVQAERDQLAAQLDARATRHEASLATITAEEDILANQDSYESPEAVVDALAALATPDAKMDDEVFGAVNLRQGWYYTLFGDSMDARIDVHHHWLSEDGSQGGSLWVWHGTNSNGKPFELVGISLMDYDDQGRLTNEFVTYPYPDEYVEGAVDGAGTPASGSLGTQ